MKIDFRSLETLAKHLEAERKGQGLTVNIHGWQEPAGDDSNT
jgi:hypothetical protein